MRKSSSYSERGGFWREREITFAEVLGMVFLGGFVGRFIWFFLFLSLSRHGIISLYANLHFTRIAIQKGPFSRSLFGVKLGFFLPPFDEFTPLLSHPTPSPCNKQTDFIVRKT